MELETLSGTSIHLSILCVCVTNLFGNIVSIFFGPNTAKVGIKERNFVLFYLSWHSRSRLTKVITGCAHNTALPVLNTCLSVPSPCVCSCCRPHLKKLSILNVIL